MPDDQPVFPGVQEAIDHVTREHAEADQGKSEDSVAATEEEKTFEGEEETEEETEEESSEESGEAEEEELSDEESDEEDKDDEEDDEPEFLFKVGEGDDEEVITDVEEARKGYLRQKDYTRKTQQAAKAQKEADAVKVELLQTKAEFLNGLAEMKAAASEQLSQFMGIDWQALQKDDPIEFEEKKQELEAAKLAFENSNKAGEELEQELTRETMEYAQKVRQEEMLKLSEFIPEVLVQGDKTLESVLGFGVEMYGFTGEELQSIYDNRMIRVLADAQKYNQTKDKLKVGKSKAKSVKKTVKPKGSASKSTAKARTAKAVKKALNQEGGISMVDAMRLIGK